MTVSQATYLAGQPLDPNYFVHLFARRDDFVGQVVNLRPIVNRPSAITYKCQHRLRLAAMLGRLATCGRLGIGLSPDPTYFQQVALGFRPCSRLFSTYAPVGFCRKTRSRQGSPMAQMNALRLSRTSATHRRMPN